MKPSTLQLAASVVMPLLMVSARADYLEVTRTATLRAAPTRDSDSVTRIDEGASLTLVDQGPTSGYYHARLEAANAQGWIYRTFVKRNTGNSPDDSAGTAGGLNPNETDVSLPADHAWGQPAKSEACRTSDGLPDGSCTPGDILVDEDESVICSPAFKTGTVRDQTTSRTQKRTVYPAYSIPFPPAGKTQGLTQVCEIDHLVPLQLGGADTLANLWPECSAGYANWQGPGFRDKDGFENYLWFRVCKKQDMSLHDAQIGIATDWRKEWERAGKPVCHNRSNCK